MHRFVGIDLAWAVDTRHTAIVVLEGGDRRLRFAGLSSDIRTLQGITDFVVKHAVKNSVVAVDAPLVVKNDTGQRICETDVGRAFGRFGASCHSTNRRRLHFEAGERLVQALHKHNFVHEFRIEDAKHRGGRWIFEVYPHPAMIRLFGLDRVLSYEKGTANTRRSGLRTCKPIWVDCSMVAKDWRSYLSGMCAC